MCVSILADLPGRSVTTTSTCTMKLECFNKIRTHGKINFENKFLAIFLEGKIFINEIGALNFSRNYGTVDQEISCQKIFTFSVFIRSILAIWQSSENFYSVHLKPIAHACQVLKASAVLEVTASFTLFLLEKNVCNMDTFQMESGVRGYFNTVFTHIRACVHTNCSLLKWHV